MQTTRYDERQVNDWLSRIRLPAFAWAALFGLFAVAGSFMSPESMITADAPFALSVMGEVIAAPPPRELDSARATIPEVADPAISAHEALDPIGAGRSGTP